MFVLISPLFLPVPALYVDLFNKPKCIGPSHLLLVRHSPQNVTESPAILQHGRRGENHEYSDAMINTCFLMGLDDSQLLSSIPYEDRYKPVAEFISHVLALSHSTFYVDVEDSNLPPIREHVAAPAHHQPASSTCRPNEPALFGLPSLPPIRHNSSLIVSPELAASPPRSWPILMTSVLDPPLMSVRAANIRVAAPARTPEPAANTWTAPTGKGGVKTQLRLAESSQVTAAFTESNQVTAAFPESSQVAAACTESSHVAAAFTKSSQVTAAFSEASQVAAAFSEASQAAAASPESSQVSDASPESSQVAAASSESSQVVVAPPEPSQVAAAFPELSPVAAASFESSQVAATLTESSPVAAASFESSQFAAAFTEPSQATADLQESSQDPACQPEPELPPARPPESAPPPARPPESAPPPVHTPESAPPPARPPESVPPPAHPPEPAPPKHPPVLAPTKPGLPALSRADYALSSPKKILGGGLIPGSAMALWTVYSAMAPELPDPPWPNGLCARPWLPGLPEPYDPPWPNEL
ncbi:hypothetical protein M9458_037584, partial [Cirrhinus mrigala]